MLLHMNVNKIALITGCSSGFGYLIALKFARNGITTFASVRNLNSEGALQLKGIADKENLPLEIIKIDVTNDESVKKGVEYIIQKSKRLDILINNAGVGYYGPVEEFSMEEIQSQYDINVLGAIRTVKAVTPFMRRQKKGLIINVSSVAGLVTFPLYGLYSSSKYALEALTDALAFELKPFGIKVCIVEPGSFDTKFRNNVKISSDNPEKSYTALKSKFISKYESAHNSKIYRKFKNPQAVADLTYSITNQQNPKLRYPAGAEAYLFPILRKLIPDNLWLKLLSFLYEW